LLQTFDGQTYEKRWEKIRLMNILSKNAIHEKKCKKNFEKIWKTYA